MLFYTLAQVDVKSAGDAVGKWTQDYGIAVVLLFGGLFALAFAAWKITRWTGQNILIPLRDAGISHLSKTDATLESVKDTMVQISRDLGTTSQAITNLDARHSRWVDEQNRKLNTIKCQPREPEPSGS